MLILVNNLFKPGINIGEFRRYFELFEKSCRGRHHPEISNTNTKTMISSLWMHPQGCQKNHTLESGIDVGHGITVGPEKLVKIINAGP